MDLLDIGKKIVSKGLSIVFVNDNKVPSYTWEAYQHRVPTEKELEIIYANMPSIKGIALVLGKVSGNIICFDFDNMKSFELLKQFANDVIYKLITETKITKTRRGYHVFFRVPEDDKIPSRKFQKSKIELRAEGNFVIIPPSVINGHKYEYINNNPISEISGEVFYALLKVLEDFDKNYELVNAVVTIINNSSSVYVEGNRDNFIFGLSGLMKKMGISKEYCEEVVNYICNYFDDEEKKSRILVVRNTYNKTLDDNISGYNALYQLFTPNGKEKLDQIVKALDELPKDNNKQKEKPTQQKKTDNTNIDTLFEKIGFKSTPKKIIKYTTNPAIYEIEFDDDNKIKFRNSKALFDRGEFILKYFELYDDIVIMNKDEYIMMLSYLVRNTLQYKEITQQDIGDVIIDIVENLISESRTGYEHYKTSFIDCKNGEYAFTYALLQRHLEANNIKSTQQEVLKAISSKFNIKNDSRKVGKSGKSVRFYFIKKLNLLSSPNDGSVEEIVPENIE